MPLTKCPDCAKELSPLAPACTNCGRPMVAPTPVLVEATGKRCHFCNSPL